MSGQATGWVLRHGPRDRALRAVLVVIADAANRDGEHAHPGIEALIEGSLYSRATVYRALRRLVDDGWLEVEQEHAPGRATVFRIPGVLAGERSHGERSTGRTGDANRSHRCDEQVASGPDRALYRDGLDGNTNGATVPVAVDAFDAFWSAYPRRNGKRIGRADAELKWRRLKPEERVAALVGAEHYAEACERGLTIAADAHRWLEKRRWLDWQEPAAADRRPPTGRPSTMAVGLQILDEMRREGQDEAR